jgi:ubiquinone/menaquinone biosynthesis C-methylase UbiE
MMTTADDTAPISTKGLVLRRAQARWYDALAAALTLGRDRQLRERLVELARIAAGESVLDVGCGTGTLALAAKRVAGAEGSVVGVDASPDMIALATAKASRTRSDVAFRAAAAERLPFADATFDVVLSTLMLHHLPAPLRRECVREARRVLAPGGRMLAVDFAAPSGRRGGLVSRFHRHGGVPLEAIAALLRDAGFRIVEQGSVGVSDLQYVLGEVPRTGESLESDGVPIPIRSLPALPAPRWIVPAIAVVAIAAHLAVAQQIVARVAFSAVGVAIVGLVEMVLVMHLPKRR